MPRRKPFSSKQKKKQLQERRLRKQGPSYADSESNSDLEEDGTTTSTQAESAQTRNTISVTKINQQPTKVPDRRLDPNRFRLHFFKETDEELQKRKAACRKAITPVVEKDLETDLDDVYRPGTVLDLPKRPEWDSTMTKNQLEQREDNYFQKYLDDIFSVYGANDLSYFDMNLETWRQLWRVLEMSDVLLLITDIRHPALHFSPALYDHVTRELEKPMILVLNKIDLAPLGLVAAWRNYFQNRFPKLHIVYFTSHAEATKDRSCEGLNKGFKKGRRIMSVGSTELLEACEKIVGNNVDLASWRTKVEGHDLDKDTDTAEDEAATTAAAAAAASQTETDHKHVRYRDGVLTIGCVGYPNVGKSSLINGLVGRKVVSVSKTPGHTKHFQTIFLTPTVKFCDCPGLVFPSLIEKPLQLLAGIYPIAQVREPYSCIAYLASRIDVPAILRLKHPDQTTSSQSGGEMKWSAFDICTAWAIKNGYNTARGARPDVYRAANHILRLAVEGRLRLNFYPPGYTDNKEYWRKHPDVDRLLKEGQAIIKANRKDIDVTSSSSDSEAEEVTSSPQSTNQKPEESTEAFGTCNPFALLTDE